MVISSILLDKQFIDKNFTKLFLWIVFIINSINMLVFGYSLIRINHEINVGVFEYLNAFFREGFPYSFMYSNPNHLGMIAGIALLLGIMVLKRENNKFAKFLYVLNILVSCINIVISHCASCWIGLFCAISVIVIVRFLGNDWKKRLTIITLIGSLVVCTLMYGFVRFVVNENNDTNIENKLNAWTSTRYELWKDMAYAHSEKLFLGEGNITREKQVRYQYNLDKGTDLGMDANGSLMDYKGPHNGYFAVFYCAGLLGLVAFIYILFRKIRRSPIIEDGYLYAIVVYILIINLVESMFITSVNIPCLFLFVILNMEKEREDQSKEINNEGL